MHIEPKDYIAKTVVEWCRIFSDDKVCLGGIDCAAQILPNLFTDRKYRKATPGPFPNGTNLYLRAEFGACAGRLMHCQPEATVPASGSLDLPFSDMNPAVGTVPHRAVQNRCPVGRGVVLI